MYRVNALFSLGSVCDELTIPPNRTFETWTFRRTIASRLTKFSPPFLRFKKNRKSVKSSESIDRTLSPPVVTPTDLCGGFSTYYYVTLYMY